MIRRYFEDELRYLLEEGKAFAKLHPDQARYLNIDSLTDRDPYVERLFEGFAFLTGRIAERIDDELPQYTESLLRLLHPHFVKTVPSLSILQFNPRPGMLQQSVAIERGTEVRSGKVGPESTVCRFQTTYDTRLLPIKLLDVRLEWPTPTTSSVSIQFQMDRGIEYQKLGLDRIRLHFFAQPNTASSMHLYFTRHVARVMYQGGEQNLQVFGQKWVRPVGFEKEHGLLPYAERSFAGYRLLHEYFSFQPKFWFVDILFPETFNPRGSSDFKVQVSFDRAYPEDRIFKTENIRLFCTPIINLFEADTEPIRIEHLESEYRVVPDANRLRSVCTYDVLGITGLEEETGRRNEYLPFFSFEHNERSSRFFVESSRVGLNGRRDSYISIGGYGSEVERLPAETLTIEARCTNGNTPREFLQEGGINQPAPGFTNVTTFSNLTRPTRELQPPVRDQRQFFWKLISHLSLSRQSVASRDALVSILQLYDWTDSEANKRRISGIRDVQWKPKEMVYRGGVIRGAEVIVEVQDDHFPDEGDLNLFGLVLSTFYSMYATMNSFVHTTLLTVPSGKRYRWEPPKGEIPVV